jgi:Domain of unknown function (DUF4352)/Protein of unknown function (DUF2510)
VNNAEALAAARRVRLTGRPAISNRQHRRRTRRAPRVDTAESGRGLEFATSAPPTNTEGKTGMTVPTQPPPPQPGFYPDSQGVSRWWDGRQWTGQVQSPPQPGPPPQPVPPKKKGWARMAILLSILGIAGCGAIINGIGSEDTATTTTTVSSTAAAGTEPEPELEPEPDPEPTQETVKIGEKVRDDGYQFTVTRVKCGVSRVGDQYWGDKAQGQFCLVDLRVKNVSDDPIYYSEENQALVDTKGKTYSADDEAWIHVDSDPFGEINPGNTLKTTVPFDISKRAKPDYLLLKAGVWGFSEGVRGKL